MEMHQVRYFLAAASALNFTKAAAHCGVSPPSLLRAIRLLEIEFGGPLFNRERGNTHLTELGRIALPHLEQIQKQADGALQKASCFLSLQDTTLRVGIMCTISPDAFVSLLAAFRGRYPSVVLKLIDGDARSLEDRLLVGELEAAIYCIPGQDPNERTHTLPMFRERMVIAVISDHPLAHKATIAGNDLHGLPYLDRANCEFTSYADRIFSERNIDGPTVFESDRDDWILAMVASGAGYAFIPQSSVNGQAGIAVRPLVEPEFWRTVNLVTVRGRPHPPALGAFVREVARTKWLGQEPHAVPQTRALSQEGEASGA